MLGARCRARRRPAQLLSTVIGIVALVVLAPATAAFAGGGDGPPPDQQQSGGETRTVNRCVLYANPAGFGADCAGGKSAISIKLILHGDPFPECRDDPIPGDVSPPSTHDGEEGAWYLETCLKGIKPDGTGDFTRTIELVWFPKGKPVPVLTENQKNAWDSYRSTYPKPVPQFGPAAQPRVLIPTFFWLTNTTGATISRTVYDGTRDMVMRARVDQIEVWPGVSDTEKPFTCNGPVPHYDFSRDIFDQPSNCTYEYQRSSAYKPGEIYNVMVQADWVVEYQVADGSWQRLGAFPLSDTLKTPVDEIQTVVD
jgi:hypothetical protein